MLIRLWHLAMLTLGIAALCGVRGSGIALAIVLVVGDALLPSPPGPQKYP